MKVASSAKVGFITILALSTLVILKYIYSYYTQYANPIDSFLSTINEKDIYFSKTADKPKMNPKVTDYLLTTVSATSLSNSLQHKKPTIVPDKHSNRKAVTVETNQTSSSSTTPHGQRTEKHIDKTADKLEMNPKALDYLPLNGPLSKRPTSTLHPDSLNPKRTYNTEPPNLPPCHRGDDKVVSIYIESQGSMDGFFIKGFPSVNSTSCNLPDGVECKTQSVDKASDAVFRFVYFINSNGPLRYCQGQTLIVFNSEALRGTGPNYQQLDLADFRIDQFLTSDAYWKHYCMTYSKVNHHLILLSEPRQLHSFSPIVASSGEQIILKKL